MNKRDFGKFILSLTSDFYTSTLLPNNKPHHNEWTILSSIILEHNSSFKLICFSNGTHSLPNKHYFSKQFQLFDCHSEILTLKTFQFFLLKCLTFNLITTFNLPFPSSSILSPSEYSNFLKHKSFFSIFSFSLSSPFPKIHFNPSVHFHMYISSSPCGQCSPFDGSKLINECLSHFNIFDNNNELSFKTKSIRSDYKKDILSLSLSCSDKLMMKTLYGFQGMLLSELMCNVYMKSIIISNTKKGMDIKNGMNVMYRKVGIDGYKEVDVIEIEEDVFAGNVERKDKNSLPFCVFYYYGSTIQKVDGTTGLKCGSRMNNGKGIEKLRTTISKYDLWVLFYNVLMYIQEGNINKELEYIDVVIEKIRKGVAKYKVNGKVNLEQVMKYIIERNCNYKIKMKIFEMYPILYKFHNIKHELILNNK